MARVNSFFRRILPRSWVKNIEENRARKELIIVAEHKKYLEKYVSFKKYPNEIDTLEYNALPIWQLWLQGADFAPPLVKNCFQSIAQYNPTRKIILLNENNLGEYIDLPDYIIDKYKKGIISRTHFSDIVRICLLAEHGGTWIDSTVLMTDSMPEEIAKSDFFCFSSPPNSMYYHYHLISSWFIHAQPKHPFMLNIRDTLFDYWKQEEELIDYFLLHICFRNMVDHNAQMAAIWKTLYHLPNDLPHLLSHQLKERFSEAKFDEIKAKSAIHKLTYKIKPKKLKAGSFFEILSREARKP
ncbi:capsular polysaccharide synthesis protein [[Pasteurella] aerogenes]|nr:capsular polysaccharide synthesis protein [[Pasteurella] aerogenes]